MGDAALSQGRALYSYLTGQYDNLGDAILRRGMMAQLGPVGSWHVYLGGAPSDYVASLELPGGTTIYRSFVVWFLAACIGMMRFRRSAFVSNPGEISSTRIEFLWGVVGSVLMAIGMIFQNPGYRLGIGARDKSRPLSLGHETATRLAARTVWRDATSSELFGRGDIAPDWAFALSGRPPGNDRRFIALIYRSDKPLPSLEILQAVGGWAAERGKELLVVTQVSRDYHANCRLAKQLNVPHIGREGANLIQMEHLVRATYAETSIVLGNRIHGLILGAVDGAVPAVILGHPDLKVRRTLRAAGLHLFAAAPISTPESVVAYLDGLEGGRLESVKAVKAAGERLRQLSCSIRDELV
ncbi:hypothetical protein [Agromyces salentinus]|uniref:Polysaccharide pyruvyl transferase family protein n=1 Tax=Agromyces salentinus TaxID=269421 RepID=A0ABN2MUU0_9MICO|nr:hypothetical protein [Agromyces salentinus]